MAQLSRLFWAKRRLEGGRTTDALRFCGDEGKSDFRYGFGDRRRDLWRSGSVVIIMRWLPIFLAAFVSSAESFGQARCCPKWTIRALAQTL